MNTIVSSVRFVKTAKMETPGFKNQYLAGSYENLIGTHPA
jgi:hypothetical protein